VIGKVSSTQTNSLALLIDADNTPPDMFPYIMKRVARLGKVTIRRVYGNTETLISPKWKKVCLRYALQPVHHVGVSGVKNATDIALTVDAMDILYKEGITKFCLITGDQDFTALILRLRSGGHEVFCIGRPSKSESLTKACTEFISLEQLAPPISVLKKIAKAVQKELHLTTSDAKKPHTDAALIKLLQVATKKVMDKKHVECVLVSQLGSSLKQLDPQFTAKTYGQKSLPELVKTRTDIFDVRNEGNQLAVRLKH